VKQLWGAVARKIGSRVVAAGAGASLGLLSALAAWPAFAQQLTLAEAYNRMFEREVQYQILDLEQAVADEVVRQARGQRLPRVGLRISYIYTQQQIISQDNETFEQGNSTYPTANITFTVTQPIYDPVSWRALPVARAENALIGARAEVARNELSTLLVGAFLDVARAQIALEQARVMIRARTQLERDIELQVDAGRVQSDILLRAQGDLFEARATQAEREFELTNALFELYRFTGPDVTGVRYAGGAIGIPNFDALVRTFSAARLVEMAPVIQVARAELDVAERQLHATRAAFRPTANLTLELEYERTEGSLFGGGSEVATAELGVSMDWQIYDGGVRRSRVREAEARVGIARLRLQQVTELSQRRYEALTAAIQRALQSVSALGQEQAASQRRLSAASEQQRAGRIGPEIALEARLRGDTLALQTQIARLRVVQLQAELLALFGALDIDTLSRDFRGA
jgi:outer membrane protein